MKDNNNIKEKVKKLIKLYEKSIKGMKNELPYFYDITLIKMNVLKDVIRDLNEILKISE